VFLLPWRLLSHRSPLRWTQARRSASFATTPLSHLFWLQSKFPWLILLQDQQSLTARPLSRARLSLLVSSLVSTSPRFLGTWWVAESSQVTASHQVAESGQVTTSPPAAVSSQAAASSQVAASCSCRSLAHPAILWHHCLGHSSIPHLRSMARHHLVSGLPRVFASLPPSPALPCTPCVAGCLRATPHSSSLRPASAPFQTLHLDIWGPAPT
ncbi:unnamed protein product, partial [Closterium sp. NIES-54]